MSFSGAADGLRGAGCEAGERSSAPGGAPWAVADQMAISAANFVTVVLLARGLSQADFGYFTLVYSVLLFANSLQAGLVTQPHNILGATRRGTDYCRYTTSTAVSQLVLAALLCALGLASCAHCPAGRVGCRPAVARHGARDGGLAAPGVRPPRPLYGGAPGRRPGERPDELRRPGTGASWNSAAWGS